MTADALNTIFALSKGHFPEAQEAEERRDWPSLFTARCKCRSSRDSHAG
jgi:hypothetical protein